MIPVQEVGGHQARIPIALRRRQRACHPADDSDRNVLYRDPDLGFCIVAHAPGVGVGEGLKPKFGDIGGVFYTEVSEDREACRQAIKNKIALCRQNTSFVSNTKDRKYPGCLPIFEQQAETCVAHFRRQAGQCEIQGSARITDFTGFACTVTATVVEGSEQKAVGEAAKTGKSSKFSPGFIKVCKSLPPKMRAGRFKRDCPEALGR